jgi:competence protein ComEC
MTRNDKSRKMYNTRRRKNFARVFILAIVSILIFFIFLLIDNEKKELQVSFFDVGQGDSSLIRTPEGKIILIDGGPNNLVVRRLGEKLPFYKRKIDLIVISHYHDDHILGLIEIMRRYKVNKIIYASETETSSLLDYLLLIAKKEKTESVVILKEVQIKLDDYCSIIFINPLSLKIKVNENNSLIAQLDCKQKKFLFSGDNGFEVEKALLNSNLDLRANIFKVSHHGSKTSNSIEFLKAVSPDKMVISVGLNNRFGHPALEILDIANILEIKVLRTDILGTIDIFSNIP